jgi:hypothetical protein
MRSILFLVAIATLAGCSPSHDAVLPDPVQGSIVEGPVLDASGRISRIADFRAKVLVLKRKDYSPKPADPLSAFSPVDMVMAWGRAGLKQSRDGVSIAQGGRRYGWTAGAEAWARTDVKEFGLHTANWHMIPADESVSEGLDDVSSGDLVEIEGDLVSVALAGGVVARSSTRRDDDGDGACEIVRVTSIRILD